MNYLDAANKVKGWANSNAISQKEVVTGIITLSHMIVPVLRGRIAHAYRKEIRIRLWNEYLNARKVVKHE